MERKKNLGAGKTRTSICSRDEDESQRGFRRIGKGMRDIQIS